MTSTGMRAGIGVSRKRQKIFGKVVQHKGQLYRLHGTGDELAVLLLNYDEAEARATAERIRLAIERQSPGRDIQVTASIGGVVATSKIGSQEALRLADNAMYVAKRVKNRVHFDTDEAPPPPKSQRIDEILAMRDRDLDNDNGQVPSPKEIAKQVRNAPLYQQNDIARRFVGTKVRWRLRLREVFDGKILKAKSACNSALGAILVLLYT
jgi:Diguanylate cyclase, GGDEF domain